MTSWVIGKLTGMKSLFQYLNLPVLGYKQYFLSAKTKYDFKCIYTFLSIAVDTDVIVLTPTRL